MFGKIAVPFGAELRNRTGSGAGGVGGGRFHATLLSATALTCIAWAGPAWAGGCGTLSIDMGQSVNSNIDLGCDAVYVGDSGTGSLTISSGKTLTDSGARIGNAAAAVGTVTVSNAGSTWTNNGALYVGYQGSGELTVSAGGVVTNTDGYVGGQGGSSGRATVTGTGSHWNMSGNFWVGSNGDGELTISDGGRVTNNAASVGQAAGKTATVLVTGANSTWTSNAYMNIGVWNTATGRLTVSGGGTVASANSRVGYFTGSTGIVTITGSGSTWTDSGEMRVGHNYGSTGRVTVESGGKLETNNSSLGYDDDPTATNDAVGTVTVTGSGSSWKSNGTLNVGHEGRGVLTLSNGGTLNSSITYIGEQAGSSGTVTVSGSGTNWNNSSVATLGLAGTGTLTLTERGRLEVNGGTGPLTIASIAGSTGTLVFGSAAGETATAPGWLSVNKIQFGSGTGKIVFNHTDTDFEFWRTITGAGGIDVHAGTTALTGTSDYSGATTVHGGSLMVNGSITSASTVKNGGTLGGTGRLGAVTVESGGIFAPGDPVARGKSDVAEKLATVRVNGNFTLKSRSILAIEVSDPGPEKKAAETADKVRVTGAVDVSGGTLKVTGLSGAFDDDQYVHTIIDNDGVDAVTGTFGTIDNKLAFYAATVDYAGGDGNDAVLTLARNANKFEDVAVTPNEKAVAAKLSRMPGSDGDTIRNSILGLSGEATRNAYQQLSGDIHATAQQVNIQVSQQVHQQVVGRLTNLRAMGMRTARRGLALSAGRIAGFAPRASWASRALGALGFSTVRSGVDDARDNGFWIQAVGGIGEVEGDENAASVDYDWRGLVSGYDIAVSPRLRLGSFFGYADGSNTQTEVKTRLDTESLMAGIYGEYDLDDWRIRAQGGWNRVAADSRRTLAFGSVDRTALANYTDNVVTLEAEVAYGFAPTPDLWLEPYGVAVVQQQFLDGFTEIGAGSANLSRASDWVVTGSGTVGLRVSGLWDSGKGWQLVPQAGIGWKHHFGPSDNGVTLSFGGGTPFSVSGTPTDPDTLVGNLGISRIADNGWQAYAAYRPSLSNNREEHSFVAGLRFEW